MSRIPRTAQAILALAVLAAAVALAATQFGGDEPRTVRSDDGDPALGLPGERTAEPEGEAEGEGDEAAEHRLSRRQARLTGSRRAGANRRSAPVAAAAAIGRARPISGPTLLRDCPGLPGTVDDYEAEPHLAVNPRDHRNVIAAWQQDRSYAARGSVASYSRDGGHHWRTVTVPGADTCQRRADRMAVADPWLAFGADGTAYLASLPGGAVTSGNTVEIRSEVIVNRSKDGGRTWSAPSTVVPASGFNDKPAIAADPRRPRLVYAVWESSTGATCTGGGTCAPQVFFSRSRDRARTWSRPVAVAPDGEVAQHDARLAVTADGRLRIVFERGDFREERRVTLVGSDDGGATWSRPRLLVTQVNHLPEADGLRPFYAIFEEAFAGDPSGDDLYLAYVSQTGESTHAPSKVLLRASRDGGRTWSRPRVVADVGGLAMLPSVAAGPHGRVAVTWYDYAADRDGDGQATAAYRGAVSRHGLRRWRTMSFGTFDTNRCGDFSPPGLPGPKLPWIGEYFGLAAQGGRFLTAFVGCGAKSARGPEDILVGALR